MSTNDVPGARAENHDQLAIGCWAEHDDGSLVLVESTEAGRVIFSVFDLALQLPAGRPGWALRLRLVRDLRPAALRVRASAHQGEPE
jgi:hypothetical protein